MFTFDFITDQLIVGSCPKSKNDIKLLSNAGVTSILNLQSDRDLKARNININTLSEIAESYGIRIHRIPMIDFDDASLSNNLIPSSELIHRLLSIEHKVYIHCNAGIERAPTVAINYLVVKQSMLKSEAVKLVTSKRASNPKLHLI